MSRSNIAEREAALLRLGLRLGVSTVGDVVEWADERVLADQTPSSDLLDLATMAGARPVDVLSILGRLSGECCEVEVLETVFAKAHALLAADRTLGPRFVKSLDAWAAEVVGSPGSDILANRPLSDSYDLVEQGVWGTASDVDREVLEFLRLYGAVPPAEIDGASVLWSADVSGCDHTGKIRHYRNGELQSAFERVAICAYEGDSSAYIFHCDREWVTQNDDCFSSPRRSNEVCDRAIRQALVTPTRQALRSPEARA